MSELVQQQHCHQHNAEATIELPTEKPQRHEHGREQQQAFVARAGADAPRGKLTLHGDGVGSGAQRRRSGRREVHTVGLRRRQRRLAQGLHGLRTAAHIKPGAAPREVCRAALAGDEDALRNRGRARFYR